MMSAALQIELERDLEEARAVQRGFMPKVPATLPGVRVIAEYAPASQVGGDFFDVLIPRRGDRILIVIGDVMGHSVSSALWMSRVTMEVRRLGVRTISPRLLLAQLHRELAPMMTGDHYMTIVCATIEPATHLLRVANAGHPAPVVRRASGEAVEVGAASGTIIPFDSRPKYVEEVVQLHAGEIVVFTTDGVTDALRTLADPLGTRAFRRILQRTRRFDRIVPSVLQSTARQRVLDDRTLVACQIEASAAPDQRRPEVRTVRGPRLVGNGHHPRPANDDRPARARRCAWLRG